MATAAALTFESLSAPGPGCSNKQSRSSAAMGIKTSVSVGAAGASSELGTSSNSGETDQTCNPDFNQTQVTDTKYTRSTAIDNSKFIMTKNSMKAISESTNQMIVNSLTKTTSSSTQNVDLTQKMKINLKGCAGNAKISGVSQSMTIDMSNIATMTMSAIDNVRTDLSNGVLAQIKNNISDETMNKMQQDINTQVASQQTSDSKQQATSVADVEQKTQLPMAQLNAPQPTNLAANVHVDQKVSSDMLDATVLSAPYHSTTDISKTLETHVNNSVTQNFTKETVNILAQTITAKQDMEISAEDIGGDCIVENISQNMNVILRQQMTNTMNLGTSVMNTLTNTLGISSEDTQITKTMNDNKLTNITDLQNGQTSKTDMTSSTSFKSKVTQDFGGCGSCGSSGSSIFFFCSCCIICICIISGCIGVSAASGAASSMGDASSAAPTDSLPTDSLPIDSAPTTEGVSTSDTKGGFYFY